VVTRLVELIRAGRTAEAHAAEVSAAARRQSRTAYDQLVNKAESDVVSGIARAKTPTGHRAL
jgi:hypothetical protein